MHQASSNEEMGKWVGVLISEMGISADQKKKEMEDKKKTESSCTSSDNLIKVWGTVKVSYNHNQTRKKLRQSDGTKTTASNVSTT